MKSRVYLIRFIVVLATAFAVIDFTHFILTKDVQRFYKEKNKSEREHLSISSPDTKSTPIGSKDLPGNEKGSDSEPSAVPIVTANEAKELNKKAFDFFTKEKERENRILKKQHIINKLQTTRKIFIILIMVLVLGVSLFGTNMTKPVEEISMQNHAHNPDLKE